jgi:short-subunit dehydrogenase
VAEALESKGLAKQASSPLRWNSALVTGASSGIGECIARRLAADNTGVVLVARRRDRLEALAAELRQLSATEVEVLPADLTDFDERLRVEQRLASASHPIDLLVNNAGGMHLSVFPDGSEDELIRLMIVAIVRLTAAVLPVMRQRGRGSIINLSSGAAFHPHPYAAVYGGCKAFINSFSMAIGEENRAHGVSITAVCPGFTRTALAETSGFDESKLPRLLWSKPEQVAKSALEAAARGQPLCIPGLLNKVDALFGRYAPRRLIVRAVARSTRRSTRKVLS